MIGMLIDYLCDTTTINFQAYHKANDERKQYVLEINSTKGNIEGVRTRQKVAVNIQQREVEDMSRSPRLMG